MPSQLPPETLCLVSAANLVCHHSYLLVPTTKWPSTSVDYRNSWPCAMGHLPDSHPILWKLPLRKFSIPIPSLPEINISRGRYMCATLTRSTPPNSPPPAQHSVPAATLTLTRSGPKDDVANMGALLCREDHTSIFDWKLIQACHELRDTALFRESSGMNPTAFQPTDMEYFNYISFRANHTLLGLCHAGFFHWSDG
jgi:hypothetical protein